MPRTRATALGLALAAVLVVAVNARPRRELLQNTFNGGANDQDYEEVYYDYEYVDYNGDDFNGPGNRLPDKCDLTQDGSFLLPGKKDCDLLVKGDQDITRIPGGIDGVYNLYTCKNGMPAYMRPAGRDPDGGRIAAATIAYSPKYNEWEFDVPGMKYLVNDTDLPLLVGEEDTVAFSDGGTSELLSAFPYEIERWHVVLSYTSRFHPSEGTMYDYLSDAVTIKCADKHAKPLPDVQPPLPAPAPGHKPARPHKPEPLVPYIHDQSVKKVGGGVWQLTMPQGLSLWATVYAKIYKAEVYSPIDGGRSEGIRAAVVRVRTEDYPRLQEAVAGIDREGTCPIDEVKEWESASVLLTYEDVLSGDGHVEKVERVGEEGQYMFALVTCASLQEFSAAVRVAWCNYTTDVPDQDKCNEELKSHKHTYSQAEPKQYDPTRPETWFDAPEAGPGHGGGHKGEDRGDHGEGHSGKKGAGGILKTLFVTVLVVGVLAAAAFGGRHVAQNGLPESLENIFKRRQGPDDSFTLLQGGDA